MEPVPASANTAPAPDSDAVEDEDGFRPMRVAALAGAAARPAEGMTPAPEEAAIETAEATVDTGGARQQAANAFYARLRAIGPER
ncbi:hypothetical protein FW320_34430, partial [Azospirillum sp. Vi22]|nr:hypothetical protein [Azospirillum baldaniorum]